MGVGSSGTLGSIIGDQVIHVVLEIFKTSKLLQKLNATSITLIPKVVNIDNPRQFRRFAYYNVVYKYVSKILCKRLKEVLPSLVSETQATFMQTGL